MSESRPAPDAAAWARVSPWLDALLELDPPARAARLDALRADDPPLADELAVLLAAHDGLDDDFLAGHAVEPPAPATLAGRRLGAYTLVRELGAGGMGSVWLGRRDDGRFDGEVAIKLPSLALLSRGGAERFAREGRVLARLAHPHIARLLDAGVADAQPYLVLEYIDGQPIDRWCDAQALGVRARLALFLDVLAAVAHAHSQLVLHRDLKPSNILVDRDGRVKLLDFGVAKLLGDSGPAAATELTLQAGRAFTPEYAAPEQVRGEPVSTATDVYALGVLLYVLLGGRHPTAQPTDAPLARLRSTLETEPATLSQAVQTAHDTAAAAAARATTTVRLARELRGDLDNIVAKALKKPVAERYPTVEALADDLRRHLDHQPVSARPDSLRYRSAKFLRRYRLAVGAASATLLALVAGVVGTGWQAWEAQRQRDIARAERATAEQQRARAQAEQARAIAAAAEARVQAERADAEARRAAAEAQRADAARQQALSQARRADREAELARNEARRATAVQNFVLDVFRGSRVNQQDPLAMQRVTARELVDRGVVQLETALVDAPLARLEMLRVLADLYVADFGLAEQGIALERRRVALSSQVHGQRHPETARALIALANAQAFFAPPAEVMDSLDRAASILDSVGDQRSLLRAQLLREQARALAGNRPVEAARSAERAVALYRALGDEDIVAALDVLCSAHLRLRQAVAAEAACAEAVHKAEAGGGIARHRLVPFLHMKRGNALLELMRIDAAAESYLTAVELMRKQYGAEHRLTVGVLAQYAALLGHVQRPGDAVAVLQTAVQAQRAGASAADIRLNNLEHTLGDLLLKHGQPAAALALLEPSLRAYRGRTGETLFYVSRASTLVRALLDMGDVKAADALSTETLRIAQELSKEPTAQLALAQHARALALHAQGRIDEARRLAQTVPVPPLDLAGSSLSNLLDAVYLAELYVDVGMVEDAARIGRDARRLIDAGGHARALAGMLTRFDAVDARVALAGADATSIDRLEQVWHRQKERLAPEAPALAALAADAARARAAAGDRAAAEQWLALARPALPAAQVAWRVADAQRLLRNPRGPR